jgi:hypothetical protein
MARAANETTRAIHFADEPREPVIASRTCLGRGIRTTTDLHVNIGHPFDKRKMATEL